MFGLDGRKFLPWHSGYKTYIVCGVGFLLGIVQGLDKSGVIHFVVPAWVNWCLVFMGGAALRNSVSIRSQYITQTVCDLLKLILAATTIPTPVQEPAQPSDDGLTGATVYTEPVVVSELPPVRAAGTGPQQGVVHSRRPLNG
jgi:hypothetical protein